MNKPLLSTISIIILTICAYFYLNFLNNTDYFIILSLNELFFAGAYWQVLTSIFLHGSLEHLAFNMLALYAFAYRLERALGHLNFLLLYLLGGIITNIISLSYLYFQNVNMVGASGAICVLLGFMAFFIPQMRKGLLIGVVAMSFAPLILGANIAWYAHLIGFGVGYLFGFLKAKR